MRAFVFTGSPSRRPSPGLCLALEGPAAPAADDAAIRKTIERAHAAGASALTFTGGEVLARPEALDWLHAARSAGFRAVEVRSDGWLLAGAGAAERVVAAGASHIGIELLAGDAVAHDHLAAEPGSFARALRALRASREAGAATRVVVPLLRGTFRSLPSLVRRALALGISGFDFVAIDGPDRPAQPLLAHPAIAAPHLRAAIDLARTARRRVSTWSVAECLLAEHADCAVERGRPLLFDARRVDAGPIPNYFRRQHGTPCAGCTLTASCDGPMAAEVGRHGWGGYIGRNDPPPTKGDPDTPGSP